ncbi:uncharacterized protein LOC132614044 [Lycium barbarum]|uniref:uncharacterized protein LOC132614044 n=1 Tax=Lycium barbarum TaxID=112863 RepID=UPI00293E6BDB|nr:uncharacterized protein LOC132614044 [Lycium barbarum]
MKRDILEFVAQCLNYKKVKYEHKKPGGTLQMMLIPEWKWERIAIDFIVVKITYDADKLAKNYIREVVRLHGVPISIVSNRGITFTSRFWECLHEKFGTRESEGDSPKLLAAQSRQKEYADYKVRDLKFQEGKQVLLKVSPMNGVMRFGKTENLSLRYIEPFEILKRVGEVVHKLSLHPGLSGVHPIVIQRLLPSSYVALRPLLADLG